MYMKNEVSSLVLFVKCLALKFEIIIAIALSCIVVIEITLNPVHLSHIYEIWGKHIISINFLYGVTVHTEMYVYNIMFR